MSVQSAAERGHQPTPNDDGFTEALAFIGLSDLEIQLYLHLIRQAGGTADKFADTMGIAPRRVRCLLEQLEGHGLLSRVPGQPPSWLPAPPDVAIEALLARHHEQLQRVRVAAKALARYARRVARRSDTEPEVVELFTSPDVVAQRFQQLQRAARTEILAFVRSPFYVPYSGNEDEESAALSRGVTLRGVYATECLEVPDTLEHIRQMALRGEKPRVFRQLPLKLFIFDRHTALVPLKPLDHQVTGGAILVRSSALLDALHSFFEMVWDRAIPLDLTATRQTPTIDATEPADGSKDLILVLATGLKDEALARQLGISHRSFQRRVHELMKQLGADTRFQAGYQAGFIAGSQTPPTSGPR